MKLWVLAGLFTVAAIPLANASEAAVDCGLETPQLLRDVTLLSVEAAPPVASKGERPARAATAANTSPAAPGVAAPPPATQNDQRRRGGSLRRIPDAMLIDGRGVL
ncbi:MAG: hypothetical protein NW206_18760 [Hyphomonadaceae bacterium]|nr:hypothetical protein [Hyphomonadaceae bacterium]